MIVPLCFNTSSQPLHQILEIFSCKTDAVESKCLKEVLNYGSFRKWPSIQSLVSFLSEYQKTARKLALFQADF